MGLIHGQEVHYQWCSRDRNLWDQSLAQISRRDETETKTLS